MWFLKYASRQTNRQINIHTDKLIAILRPSYRDEVKILVNVADYRFQSTMSGADWTLLYCCESWHLQNKEQNRISVAWNNCFRSIFNCCWRESVKPLQYFCKVLPLNYLIHERKLLFWNKLFTSDNSVLFSLSRLVSQRFVAIACLYGLSSIHVSRQTIKQAVWAHFQAQ